MHDEGGIVIIPDKNEGLNGQRNSLFEELPLLVDKLT
jgi:hypothetical protein